MASDRRVARCSPGMPLRIPFVIIRHDETYTGIRSDKSGNGCQGQGQGNGKMNIRGVLMVPVCDLKKYSKKSTSTFSAEVLLMAAGSGSGWGGGGRSQND